MDGASEGGRLRMTAVIVRMTALERVGARRAIVSARADHPFGVQAAQLMRLVALAIERGDDGFVLRVVYFRTFTHPLPVSGVLRWPHR